MRPASLVWPKRSIIPQASNFSCSISTPLLASQLDDPHSHAPDLPIAWTLGFGVRNVRVNSVMSLQIAQHFAALSADGGPCGDSTRRSHAALRIVGLPVDCPRHITMHQ